MAEQIRLESLPVAVTQPGQTEIAGATFAPVERDPAEVIRHLTQQLDEVRMLNKRLSMMYSALQAEKSNLRYRIVDEACDILKRRAIVRRASRFLLPVARYFRWAIRQRAARQ
jgi:hypothetical protein